jgi:hypothetical protein
MRHLARTISVAAFAAATTLLPLGTAADAATPDTAAVAQAVKRSGPYPSEAACKLNRSNFTRYYHVSDCFTIPPLPNAWFFNYWPR